MQSVGTLTLNPRPAHTNVQPDEFVQAGDHLIHASPTWSWQRGDISRIRPYLPSDKQFLITRRVRCQRRVKTLQDDAAAGADVVISNEGSLLGGSESWIEPGGSRASDGPAPADAAEEALASSVVGMASSSTAAASSVGAVTSDGGDEYEDLSALMAAAQTQQPLAARAAAVAKPAPTPAAAPADDDEYADLSAFVDTSLAVTDAGAVSVAPAHMSGSLRAAAARSYDVSITYDNYFRTREWCLLVCERVFTPTLATGARQRACGCTATTRRACR